MTEIKYLDSFLYDMIVAKDSISGYFSDILSNSEKLAPDKKEKT